MKPVHHSHKKPSQAETVLAHLETGETITQDEAREKYGIARLGARIHELREHHNIDAKTITVKNRFGAACHVTQYKLIRKD